MTFQFRNKCTVNTAISCGTPTTWEY